MKLANVYKLYECLQEVDSEIDNQLVAKKSFSCYLHKDKI